jgi:Septum formation
VTISTTGALAAAAALTLATLGAVVPSFAGSQQRTGAMTGAPTIGTCSTMTAAQGAARSDHSTVVDCAQSHSAEVAGVVKLPTGLQWSEASSARLFRVIASGCLPQVNATLGRNNATRDSSAYDYVWFEPTKAQRDAGARWLSCSVTRPRVAVLANLPTSTVPFLPDGPLPDPVARCLNRNRYDTPCAAAHRWRAAGTFTVSGSYPGTKVLTEKATAKCAARVPAGRPYAWTYRDRTTWNVGHDHVVVCYSKTRS